ncbi:MAG: carboxyl-terminal processing protease [Candidatus Peregrinibacteria bacterium Greene0416_19]|nr:MAG: carboxyl-terminal processing protease [Candidatus Peregrinibacteria bacterium Greene0416_19]
MESFFRSPFVMLHAGMYRDYRYWLLILLALLLGWHLGMRYQVKVLEDKMGAIDRIFSPATGSGQVMSDPEREVDLALLWSVWRLLLRFHIEPDKLQTGKMVYGAVEGLVRSIGDPYTVFMTPKENTNFRQSLNGKLQGIGAELVERDGLIIVVSPLKGSPAEKAGLAPDDIILEVDGTTVQGLTLTQVVDLIRGPKGTKVVLNVFRKNEGRERTLVIVRDEIRIPSVESSVKQTQSGAVGVIILNQFGENSINEVREALQTFKKEKPPIKALILDLRFNGGGYLEGATQLVSMFLKEGRVVSVERRDADSIHHDVNGRVIEPTLPLVVLINEGSASASEITAGALQDHKRAMLVGMPTFGKGTVQEIIDLPGGSSLRVTIAHWLTPKGKNLGKEKVQPDIKMDRTVEDAKAKRDPQLDAALEWLLDHEDVTQKASSSASSN